MRFRLSKLMSQFSSYLAFLVIYGALLPSSHAQTVAVIPPAEASKHAGEQVYVEGAVASVHATQKSAAFINLGKPYPPHVSTGVIPNLGPIHTAPWPTYLSR